MMISDAVRERRLFFMLLLGTAFLAFWRLGSLPLLDVDEPVYGQVGKELAQRGMAHWLTPLYQGQPWFDKPPLFYWLTALAMRLFGVNEFAARFPSALLAVGLVAVTYAFARRAYPQHPSVGFWAGFVVATNIQFFLLARAAVTDMTLALTLTAALFGLYQWTQTDRGRWIALAGAMTGLAALTKGPVALVLIGLQTIAFLCLTRQARRLLAPALWGGFALCLLVALPWYLAMIHLHGQTFIAGFLQANNVTRYLQAEHQKSQSPLFFVLWFPVLFFPWTLALPSAAMRAWKDQSRAGETSLFLSLWFAWVFVFFSASQSKLITYIFPLYPAAAIFAAGWLAQRRDFTRFPTFWIYAALNFLIGIAFWIFGRRFGIVPITLWAWSVILIASTAFVLRPIAPARRWLAPGITTALLLLAAWGSPTWRTEETQVSERQLGHAAAQAAKPGQTIYALTLNHPSLGFYSSHSVLATDNRHIVMAALQTPGALVATRPQYLAELQAHYGLRDFRVIRAYSRTILIQAAPPGALKSKRNVKSGEL